MTNFSSTVGLGSQASRMGVHGLYQGLHMFRWGVLADAMAEVEDVRGAGGGLVGVGFAKRIKDPACFSSQGIRWRKQGIGVEVALQRDRKSVV